MKKAQFVRKPENLTEVKEKVKKYGGEIGKTQVIQVTNTDTNESIFINPEGYDYARYVGIEWNDPRNKG